MVNLYPIRQGYLNTVYPNALVMIQCTVHILTSLLSFQWIIGELACYTYSMVAVPLYDTLGPEALVFVINRGT